MKQYFDEWNRLQTMIGESTSDQNSGIFRTITTNTSTKHASLRFIRNSMFDEENYAKEMARRQEDKNHSVKPRSLVDKDIEINYYTSDTKRESSSLTPVTKRRPLAEKDGGNMFEKNNNSTQQTASDRPRLPIRNNHFKKKVILETNFEVYGFKGKELEDLYTAKCQDLNIPANPEGFQNFLKTFKSKSSEERLNIHESGYGYYALQKFTNMLKNNDQITHLALRYSACTGNIVAPLAKALVTMPCLIHLDLANNTMDSGDMAIVIKTVKQSYTLISLDLSNYHSDKKNKFGLETAEALKTLAEGNHTLQYLRLKNLMIDNAMVAEFAKGLEKAPNLFLLDLSNNLVTADGIAALKPVFSFTDLQVFNIANNKLDKNGIGEIVKIIKSFKVNYRNGIELNLENTSIGDGAGELFESLIKDHSIQKLNISNNELKYASLGNLENFFFENDRLAELNFSNCRLGEIGGKMIATGLERNKGIKTMILASNDFGDVNATNLFISLLKNQSLKQLDLSKNRLGRKCVSALKELIKTNPRLVKYDLSTNNFSEEDGYTFQEALINQSKIVQFDIRYNSFKQTTVDAIEQILKENRRKVASVEVPHLKSEIQYAQDFVNTELHVIQDIEDNKVKKITLTEEITKCKDELHYLRIQPDSPGVRKYEETTDKLHKEVEIQSKELMHLKNQIQETEINIQVQQKTFEAQIQELNSAIRDIEKEIVKKQTEIEKVKEKYDPEVRILRRELHQMMEQNTFMETYNKTLSDKVKQQQRRITIVQKFQPPKISDMFLASSVLANHLKKNNPPSNNNNNNNNNNTTNNADHEKSSQHITNKLAHNVGSGNQSQVGISAMARTVGSGGFNEDQKFVKEYEFALKNQQERIKKLIKETESKEMKKKKKKSDSDDEDDDPKTKKMKAEIRKKLRQLEREKNILPLQEEPK